MAKKLNRAIITDEILSDAKTYTDNSVAIVSASGIYNAIPSTTPISTNNVIYNVSQAATYTNFLDSSNNPLVVSSTDLSTGLVQLRAESGSFKKVIVPISLASYLTKQSFLEFKELLSREISLSLTKVDNKFLNNATGVATDSTIREYTIIPATATDNIEISAWVSGAITALAVYFNSSMQYLSCEEVGTANPVQYTRKRLVNIHPATAFIGVTNRKDLVGSGTPLSIWKNNEIQIATEIDSITSQLTALTTAIENVENSTKIRMDIPYVILQDKYFAYNTGVLTTSTLREYVEITGVNDNDIFSITGTTIGSPTALVVFFNANNGVISWYERGIDNVQQQFINKNVKVPAGTRKIGVTNFKNNTLGFEVKKLTAIDYTQKFISIDDSIKTVENNLKEKQRISLVEVSNQFLNYATGIAASSTLRNYAMIENVNETDEYVVKACLSGSQSALAVYYDINGNYLGSQYRGTDNVNTFFDTENLAVLTLPVGTKKIGLTNMKLLSSLELYKLVLISVPTKIDEINAKIGSYKSYQNKNIVIFGDSITNGHVNGQSIGWPEVFASELGINYTQRIQNNAVPGARLSSFSDSSYSDNAPTYLLPANNTGWNQINYWLANNPLTPDYFMIALGTNEVPQNGILGDVTTAFATDINSLNQLTMCNALRKMINRLQVAYPNKPIVICTPIQGTGAGRNYNNLRNISNLLIEIGNRMGCIVIDSNNAITSQYESSDATPGRYLLDGTHPNPLGAELIGKFIAKNFVTKVFN
jgi:lysophospholipase L1-like esterase